jgi:hypothetical protein
VDYVQERNLKAPRAFIESYHIDAGRMHLGYGQKRGRLRDDAVARLATTIVVSVEVEARFRFREVGGDLGGMQVVRCNENRQKVMRSLATG